MQNAFLNLHRQEFRPQDPPFLRPDAAPRFPSGRTSWCQDSITKAWSQAVSRSDIALDTNVFMHHTSPLLRERINPVLAGRSLSSGSLISFGEVHTELEKLCGSPKPSVREQAAFGLNWFHELRDQYHMIIQPAVIQHSTGGNQTNYTDPAILKMALSRCLDCCGPSRSGFRRRIIVTCDIRLLRDLYELRKLSCFNGTGIPFDSVIALCLIGRTGNLNPFDPNRFLERID